MIKKLVYGLAIIAGLVSCNDDLRIGQALKAMIPKNRSIKSHLR